MLSLTTPKEAVFALATRVRERRLERGWTQDEIASRAGVSLGTYILFERTGKISLLRLAQVLEVLGLMGQVEQIAALESFSQKTIEDITAPRRLRGRRRSAK